jgi:hypothetical protein
MSPAVPMGAGVRVYLFAHYQNRTRLERRRVHACSKISVACRRILWCVGEKYQWPGGRMTLVNERHVRHYSLLIPMHESWRIHVDVVSSPTPKQRDSQNGHVLF